MFVPIFLIGCLFTALGEAQARTQDRSADLETRVPTKTIGNYKISVLGGMRREVFGDTGMSTANPNVSFYFLHPVFNMDWDSFKKDVHAACDKAAPKERRTVRLTASFWSDEIPSELAVTLSEKLLKPIDPSHVLVYPHYQMRVRIKTPNSGEREVMRFPPDPTTGYAMPNKTSMKEGDTIIPITATCAELKHLINDPGNIRVLMYSNNDTVSKDSVNVTYKEFVTSLSSAGLHTNQSQAGSIITSSDTSGSASRVGIAFLGSASQGSTRTTDTVTDTRIRYASGEYLMRAATKSLLDMTRISTVESNNYNASDVAKQLTDFVKNAAEKVSVEFRKTDANQWKMVGKGVDQVLSQKDVDTLFTSKPVIKVSGESEAEAKHEGTEGKLKEADRTEISGDITWQSKGGVWTPLSADLHAFTINQLSQSLKASDTVFKVTRATLPLEVTLDTPAKLGKNWDEWLKRTEQLEQLLATYKASSDLESKALRDQLAAMKVDMTRGDEELRSKYQSLMTMLDAYFKHMRNPQFGEWVQDADGRWKVNPIQPGF